MFSEDLFILALSWKQPADVLMVIKMWNIHTRECYSAIKRNDLLKHAEKWMDLKYTTMSKGSQTQKKHIPHNSIQMKSYNR